MAGRPSLLFDGDCAFCTSCADWVSRRLRPDAAVLPWQQADLAALGITAEQARRALQWVDGDGRVCAGHVAVGRLLLCTGGWWRLAGRLVLVPPVSFGAALLYRAVAANRSRLPGGTPACAAAAVPTAGEHCDRDRRRG